MQPQVRKWVGSLAAPVLGESKTMIKVKKSSGKRSHAFRVGAKVHVPFGATRRTALVVEERGAIGVGGRRIYRVRLVGPTDELDSTFEVPAEQMSLIPRASRISAATK